MSDTPWHAGSALLRRYAEGSLDQVAQAAVETHVDRCPDCRADAARLVPTADLELLWAGVERGVRTPPEPWPIRLLRRLGVRDADLVVLRTTGNLLAPLCLATLAAVALVAGAGFLRNGQQELFCLVLAPLLPPLFVAAAYDSTDPLRELTEPTPYSKLRVALLRSAVALAGALPLVVLLGQVPDLDASLAVWLLPGLALTLSMLTLLSWTTAPVAAASVSLGWLVVVGGLKSQGSVSAVATPAGQLVCLAFAAAMVFVFVRRLGFLTVTGVRS